MSPFRWEAANTQDRTLYEQLFKPFHEEDEKQLKHFTDRLGGTLLQVRYNDIPSVAYPTVLAPFGYGYQLHFLQPTVLKLGQEYSETGRVAVVLPTVRVCNQGDCFLKAGKLGRQLHFKYRGNIIGGHLTSVSIAPEDYPKLYELYIQGLNAIRQSREELNFDRNGEQVVRELAYAQLHSDTQTFQFSGEEDFGIKNIVEHRKSRSWGDFNSHPTNGVGTLQDVLRACTLKEQGYYKHLFRL